MVGYNKIFFFLIMTRDSFYHAYFEQCWNKIWQQSYKYWKLEFLFLKKEKKDRFSLKWFSRVTHKFQSYKYWKLEFLFLKKEKKDRFSLKWFSRVTHKFQFYKYWKLEFLFLKKEKKDRFSLKWFPRVTHKFHLATILQILKVRISFPQTKKRSIFSRIVLRTNFIKINDSHLGHTFP